MTARLVVTLTAAALAVIAGFTFLQLPGNTLFWNALQNSGHGIGFCVLSIVLLIVLHNKQKNALLQAVLISSGALFVLGICIELAQFRTSRDAALDDALMNGVGIVGGSCLYCAVHILRQNTRAWPQAIALVVVGAAAVFFCIRWPAAYLLSGLQRPSLPVLADFENPGAALYVSGNGSTQVVATHDAWTTNPTRSVKVIFEPGRWPNVAFQEPVKDWSDYAQISFSGFNPNDAAIMLRVRIDDLGLGHFDDDHMTVRHLVSPGAFTVVLAFDDFREDAAKRNRPGEAKFEEINQFMVFLSGADAQMDGRVVLYFDDFALQ